MTRAKVGRGAAFEIDRCGGCGGTWLDAREWEALRRLGLHDDIHFIFSAAWQADVAREERERMRDQMLLTKLGEADWAEIQRVREWLLAHRHRDELSAYLLDGLHEASPRGNPKSASEASA